MILINHRSFFQRKESSQLYRFQFFKINSLMAETIKNQLIFTEVIIKKIFLLLNQLIYTELVREI